MSVVDVIKLKHPSQKHSANHESADRHRKQEPERRQDPNEGLGHRILLLKAAGGGVSQTGTPPDEPTSSIAQTPASDE